MCFFADKCELKFASEPISCYKMMELYVGDNGGIRMNSQFYPNESGYDFGDVILPKELSDDAFLNYIYRITDKSKPIMLQGDAVHSYKCRPVPEKYIVSDFESCIYDPNGFVLVLCEIPEGTAYFENQFEYASRKLVIKGIICLPFDALEGISPFPQ